jgi:hypothetical protein
MMMVEDLSPFFKPLDYLNKMDFEHKELSGLLLGVGSNQEVRWTVLPNIL